MTLGCSACFSADPDGTVRLPFDPKTGQLIPELWQRWLDWDPVRMVPKYADALRSLPRWLDHHGYDPLGLPPLRAAIARRFTARGLPTTSEQILVVSGALQALDLRG